MNILFLGYWGANDGLSQSTILPHLEILSKMENIQKIIYCSIERTGDTKFDIDIQKVEHHPLYSNPSAIPLWDKVQDFITFPKTILQLCSNHSIEKLICRGAPAGALGYLVWKKNKIQYYVESYEPHALYMLESKVWKIYEPRYILQKKWEGKINKTATALMPVANNFKKILEQDNVDSQKIDVIPCCVNESMFRFNQKDKHTYRKKYQLPLDANVYIYVGKFGGLYVENEAYFLFKKILEEDNTYLILLTVSDKEKLMTQLKQKGINTSKIIITSCEFNEVPKFLSMSDFALALYKQSQSKQYLSPIKVGEYWANGLSVLLPKGIGDDAQIIKKENNGGIILDDYSTKSIEEALTKIKELDKATNRNEIVSLAKKYRSFDITRKVYQKWYGK